MELKKKYLGSRVYIKTLAREVEVCEENKSTFITHNLRHLFDVQEPVMTLRKEETKKENNNVSTKSTKPKRSKHRVVTNTDNS
tara:strand:+ start:289 stop:537 length:249 start_codon:yes stop_codon:yes gene_type:complete